jgi:hypothetical protein
MSCSRVIEAQFGKRLQLTSKTDSRYLVFQLAKVAVPRAMFAAVLRRIDRLREPPVAAV